MFKQKKNYEYFYCSSNRLHTEEQREKSKTNYDINNSLNKILNVIGREVLKEKIPTLKELEQIVQSKVGESQKTKEENMHEVQNPKNDNDSDIYKDDSDFKQDKNTSNTYGPIISELIKRGYLKDSKKWLSNKGFISIGNKILQDLMKELKNDDFGLHETILNGTGSLVLDSSKKYEIGDDLKSINIQKTLLNSIERTIKNKQKIQIPLNLDIEDFEEYETFKEVRVAVVYCIDLSSTMKYATLYGELSRIEAAKKALWTLFLLNKKYFPSDSIYVIGFGALASEIKPFDIPYLKTFQPGVDFLHYTNYQAAFRLAKRILQKDISENKRIVLITDGHPSACFIDNKEEQNKILIQRPYSHFYTPDENTLNNLNQEENIKLNSKTGELVYLCYRYRQVDQFIGERSISEARKCFKLGIKIDTIMISEEELLLDYINEMEKHVNGKSYYINPASIDKMLLTDYLNNKKSIVKSSS
ncbi:MAG: VWA domain-containing protein [Nitrososphaeraceae archaeon]